jgi:hypothetical protein
MRSALATLGFFLGALACVFLLAHCGDPSTLPVSNLDGGCYLDCHVPVPGGVLYCRCDTPDYLFALDRCVGTDDPAEGNGDCGADSSDCVVCQ